MQKAFIFVGPSASGKTTIEDYLLSHEEFQRLILSTSRKRRTVEDGYSENEIEGVHYFFKTAKECHDEESVLKIHINEDWLYSLAKTEVESKIDSKQNLVFSCINSEPALELAKSLIFDYEIDTKIIIFDINQEQRKSLLLNRGDSIKDIETRLKKEENLLKSNLIPDLILKDLNTSLNEVLSFVKK